MKSQSLELLKPTFPFPMAGSDSSATDIPESSGSLNMQMGFTSSYDSIVTKSDFNGVLKNITSNIAYGNAGGFYEFNPDFASAIGGYPKNAVLVFMFGGQMQLVRSLKDNNTVNFNNVGIDNVNWSLVMVDDKSPFKPDINWNAQRAKLMYSLEHGKAYGDLSSGKFESKGYVVVVENNVSFTLPTTKWWKLILIVGSNDGTIVDDLTPNDIFANPLSNSKHAFPIILIDGYVDSDTSYNIIRQVQVQEGTSYKLYGVSSTNELISSGSFDVYFLPTPD